MLAATTFYITCVTAIESACCLATQNIGPIFHNKKARIPLAIILKWLPE